LSNTYLNDRSTVVQIDDANIDQSWKEIQNATDHCLTKWGIDHLRRGLDDDVKSVFVEDQYVCKDYRNLHSNFYTKKFIDRPSRCSRLHFFSELGLSKGSVVFKPDEFANAYLGYSVIQPMAERCIGRTVIDPKKLKRFRDSDFFCLRTKFPTRIQGARYDVEGYPYRSQSSEATVCAHTVLWSVCRYLSQRYTIYREFLPFDLISRTGSSSGRRYPNRSLSYVDYNQILDQFGCHPHLILPRKKTGHLVDDWTDDRESFYDLYAYMESGFPLLASFSGHVVSLVGHTSRDTPRVEHTPFGAQQIINSAAYVDRYVVVDDNFFPYQLLGYKSEAQYYANGYASMQRQPSIDNIYAAVVPLPEKVFLSAKDSRRLAYRQFETNQTRQLIQETKRKLGDTSPGIIARQFLAAGASFKRRKRERFLKDGLDPLTRFPVSVNLPHFVWIIELTTTNLAERKQAFGEIVMDATQGKADWNPIYLRIGSTLVSGSHRINNANTPELNQFRQFIHNLGGAV
jgi:hypothetical protein